jgi:exopolysaccharide biosynthesis polyprenyl glycosylphosphotransferase
MLAEKLNTKTQTKTQSAPALVMLSSVKQSVLPQPSLTRQQRLNKRAFDIAVSGLALIALLPVMALIALAIKLTSPGPVLFKQDRVGENGKIFKIYKFRSMVVNAEKLQHLVNETNAEGQTLHKRRNDPRVTGIGKIIRKTSLDELPQFINVLFGDMSLVGPRPELPWLVAEYEAWQHSRFDVPQGITGWWQINGRSDKPCHLNTDQDVYYIENYSFMLDLVILVKTVPALLKGKGAF